MTADLKPCPFCGGTDIRPFDNSVVCNSCSATGPDLGHCIGAECRKDAIAAWNRRDLHEAAVAAARAEGMREAARLYEDETGWQKVCMDMDGTSPCDKPCWGCLINAAEASK